MGKILVVTGLLVAGIGLLVMLGVPLGRLPGDVVYRRGSRDVLPSDRDVRPAKHCADAPGHVHATLNGPVH